MAAQPIYHDEFDEIMNRFYARLSNYVDARADVLINQLRVQQHDLDIIKAETAKHFGKIEADIEGLKTDVADVRRQLVDVIAFQHALMDTFKGFATDVLKQLAALQQQMVDSFAAQAAVQAEMRQQMADGFAAQAERHNELMMRVDRLERRDR